MLLCIETAYRLRTMVTAALTGGAAAWFYLFPF